jgi:hypothetical protein
MASRLVGTNPVTVNDVLDGQKLLEIDCLDRVYLTLSVPKFDGRWSGHRFPHRPPGSTDFPHPLCWSVAGRRSVVP